MMSADGIYLAGQLARNDFSNLMPIFWACPESVPWQNEVLFKLVSKDSPTRPLQEQAIRCNTLPSAIVYPLLKIDGILDKFDRFF